MEIDENGYPRGKVEHSDLIHRQIAYSEIYLKNREKYPLPFSKYQVHHKDGNKKNFRPDNLQIVTKEEHRAIHNLPSESKRSSLSSSLGRENAVDWYNRMETKNKPSKKKRKTWLWIIIILLIIGATFYPKIKERVEMKNWADLPTTTNVVDKLPDYTVEGSKTEVIIKNNLAENISLNVTYRIYSAWFGINTTETKQFDAGAKTSQSFKVYNNDGCSSSPCSVIILDSSRI